MDTQKAPRRRLYTTLRSFMASEASGGIVLMVSAALAIIVANSAASGAYFGFLKSYVGGLSILHWINDALMVVFFLLVGLEIKQEMVVGQLSTWSRRILPGLAAVGGMLVPGLIFIAFNADAETARGWAIPTATDIAFSLGVLSLLGSRVPLSLKVFLTALAIIDDLGAVIIIALFYTADLNFAALGGAAAVVAVLVGLNRFGVKNLLPYLLLGVILWYLVLKSGVHATIAGVVLALTIPLSRDVDGRQSDDSPLHKLAHAIQPWVAFMVVPIFGFANAGVSFSGMSLSNMADPVPLGVALGLFAGKQVGVFGFTYAAVKLKLADRPSQANWAQVYGVAMLCGIGFTMSLFVGLLAFPGSELLQSETKLGVLVGSVASAIFGAMVLRFASGRSGQASP